MISNCSRKTLLASSAIVGFTAFAAFSLDVRPALADCALDGDTLVCTGDDTSTNINTKISAQPGPGLTLVTTGGKIDTAGGDISVTSTVYGGKIDEAVVITNAAQIGLTDVTGDPTDPFGLVVLGNIDETKNTVSILNNGPINGRLIVVDAGGDVDLVINKSVLGQVYAAGAGNIALSLAEAADIAGGVTIQAARGSKFEVKVDGDVTTTTDIERGGSAVVELLGDVGVENKLSPDGFTGSTVFVLTQGDASVTVGGRTGSVFVDSSGVNDGADFTQTDTKIVDKSGAYVQTVETDLTNAGGAASLTLLEGASIFGNASIYGPSGADVMIDGNITGAGNSLFVGTRFNAQAASTTSEVDDKGVTRSFALSSTSTQGGGDASVTIGETGSLEANLLVQSHGDINATIDGDVGGRVDLDGFANKSSWTYSETFDDAGVWSGYKYTFTATNVAGTTTLSLGETGRVEDVIDINTGGDVTLDIAGEAAGAFVQSTRNDLVYEEGYTPGAAGDFAHSYKGERSPSGGLVTVNVDDTGLIDGTLFISSDGGSVVSNDGLLEGSLSAFSERNLQTGFAGSSSQATTVDGTTTTVVNLSSYNEVRETVGGQISLDNDHQILGSTTLGAVDGVILDNSGLMAGDTYLQSVGSRSTFSFDSESSTVDALRDDKDATKGTQLTTDYSSTSTSSSESIGGAVTSKISGFVGLDNSAITGVPVGVVPAASFSQVANGASSIDLSGSIFANVSSTAFASQSSSLDTFDSNEVRLFDGKGVLESGTSEQASTSRFSTVLIDGATSKITISGVVGEQPNGATSNVFSSGQSGSTVTVAGGSVDGGIYSVSSGAESEFESVGLQLFDIAASGAYTLLASTQETSSASTQAGGSSNVTLSGAADVGGDIQTFGDAGAGILIGPDAMVGGSVFALSNTYDSTYNNTITTLLTDDPDIGDYSRVTEQTGTFKSSAVNGAVSVRIDGEVGGSATAYASRGSATVLVNNTVGGDVGAFSSGYEYEWASVTTESGDLSGGDDVVEDTYTDSSRSVGGAAAVTLTAPADLAASGGLLVGGGVSAQGDQSGTVTVGSGVGIGGNVFAGSGGFSSTFEQVRTFEAGVLDTITQAYSSKSVAGKASVTNAGDVDGSLFASANGGAASIANSGSVGDSIFGSSIGYNYAETLKSVNLSDPINATETRTESWTPVGGTVVIDNGGVVENGIFAFAGTGSVTNTGAADFISVGTSVDNWNLTTVTTPTSTDQTLVLNPLFSQTYTITQDGLLTDGIFVGGALSTNPIDGEAIKTSNVVAAITLKDGSVTLGPISGQIDGDTGASLTTTDVTLNGTGFLGYSAAHFDGAAPTLTADQEAYILDRFGADLEDLTFTSSIRGVRNVRKTGAGTFYVLGNGFDDNGTADTSDDLYDIKAETLVIQDGRLVLATLDPDDTFSIFGDVTNDAELVFGTLITFEPASNLDSLLNSSRQIVLGQDVLIDGDFTQGAGGSLMVGLTPDLIRTSPLAVSGATVSEVLGFANFGVSAAPFSTPDNSTIPFSTPTSIKVNGDLKLDGTFNLAVNRGALYEDGSSTPLFTVSGTTSIGASIDPMADSAFVGFGFETTKAGSDTVVSIVTQRTSYATVAGSANSAVVAGALDSAIAPTIAAIRADADGSDVFSDVETFRAVQDMANVISGFDWYLSTAQVAGALDELATSDVYGSLALLDPARPLSDAFNAFGQPADRALSVPGGRFWISPVYRSSEYDGDTSRGVTEIGADASSLTLGGQFQATPAVSFGFGLGYSQTDIDSDAHPMVVDVETYMAGLNAVWHGGPWTFLAHGVYGSSKYEAARGLPSFARTAKADFDGTEWRGSIELGYDVVGMIPGTVTPFVALDMRDIDLDGFTERDAGGVGVEVDAYSDNLVSPRIGARWTASDTRLGVFSLNPHAVLSYSFNGDLETLRTQRFIGGGADFELQGVEADDYATVGVGVTGQMGQGGLFSVEATGDFGSSRSSVGFVARAVWGF